MDNSDGVLYVFYYICLLRLVLLGNLKLKKGVFLKIDF